MLPSDTWASTDRGIARLFEGGGGGGGGVGLPPAARIGNSKLPVFLHRGREEWQVIWNNQPAAWG